MARNKTVVVRFNVANPRANAKIKKLAGDNITNVSEETKKAVRAVILDGYKKGQHPYTIALALAGKLNRVTGRREGGFIGLTTPQAFAAIDFRDRLLSGDPKQMRRALTMGLRDKRFDIIIQDAINKGEKIPAEKVSRMLGRYIDNSIALRARTIARTETGAAVSAGAHEAFAQGLEKSGHNSASVTRVWRTAGDKKVRDSHEEMDGQTVTGLDTPFVTPDGYMLLHPLDKSLGAPASEIINCRCLEEINLDFARGLLPDRMLDLQQLGRRRA